MGFPYMLRCRFYVIPENECGRFLRILALADPLPYSYGASVGGLTNSNQFWSSSRLEQNVLNQKLVLDFPLFSSLTYSRYHETLDLDTACPCPSRLSVWG